MDLIKDRNGRDLTEAEDIKKVLPPLTTKILRGGKKTQKNYTKKIFMTQIIRMV